MLAKQGTVRGGESMGERPSQASYFSSTTDLFYYFEDELVGKPSALVLSALMSLYCLIIPFIHQHNDNNTYSNNNMIMHRHPPQRDNMLHTIAMQIMALHVHTKAEQRLCQAMTLSACYSTCRPTHTYTLCLFSSVPPCILSFSGFLLLCQGPNNTPTPPRLSRPFCSPVWNSAPG